MNKEIKYSPLAIIDIEDAEKKIRIEYSSPNAARNFLDCIFEAINKLSIYPMLGAKLDVSFASSTPYRFIKCDNYFVFYRYENDVIYIDRVLYKRRNFIQLLFKQV